MKSVGDKQRKPKKWEDPPWKRYQPCSQGL